MAEATTRDGAGSEVVMEPEARSDDVIGQAVRGELAEKLHLAPQLLDDLSPEAAARTLDHLNDINRRLTMQPGQEPGASSAAQHSASDRRDIVARALRDELAEKLHVHPRLLGGLRSEAAAATLDKVNQSVRRLHAVESGHSLEGAAQPIQGERRDVVARVIRDELAQELGVHPGDLVELSPQLAATTLSHLSHVHRRLRRLESELGGQETATEAAVPDRRDVVARTIRDELAEKLGLHPALLGPLSPRAGAAMLTHLQMLNGRLESLEQRIAVDELTGALRRAAGVEALEREIGRARRFDSRLVLAFVDVDGLKAVNDTEGHAAGDALLRTAAETLRSRLRRYDLVIRWGGDEFVCVLPQTEAEGAQRILDEIEQAYRARTEGRTFSAGFAELEEADDAETLVHRADLDLYSRRRQHRENEEEPPPATPTEPPHDGQEAKKPAPLWKRWTAIGSVLLLVLGVVGALAVVSVVATPGSWLWAPRAFAESARVQLSSSRPKAEIDLARARLQTARGLAPGASRAPWLADAHSHLRAAEAAGADPRLLRGLQADLDQLAAGFDLPLS